jgi:hypothetical protein
MFVEFQVIFLMVSVTAVGFAEERRKRKDKEKCKLDFYKEQIKTWVGAKDYIKVSYTHTSICCILFVC